MVGQIADIANGWDRLVQLCTAEGIVIKREKTRGLWPFDERIVPVPADVSAWFTAHEIPLFTGCLPVLGGSVGFDDAKRAAFALEKVNSLSNTTFRLFRHADIPVQTLPPLLRSCAVPSISHIISTIPPALTTAASTAFDHLILQTFSDSMQIPFSDLTTAEASPLLQSSIRHGGIGLRPQTGITSDISFLCSYFRTAATMPYRLTTHRPNTPPAASFQIALDIIANLKLKYPLLSAILPIRDGQSDRLRINPSLTAKPRAKARRHLQNAITDIIDKTNYERFQSGNLPLVVKKTLESFSNPLARRIFLLTGSDEETRMQNPEARLLYREHLHLHAFSGQPPIICPCGASFSVDHPMCCNLLKREENTGERHDPIQNVTGKLATECGVGVQYTKRSSEATSARKPDLHFTFRDTPTKAFADVQVNHTIAPSLINRSVGAILNGSANTKVSKYKADCHKPNQPHLDFYALIISSFGVFGSEFITLLTRLAKHSIDNRLSTHDTTISQIFYRMVDRILVTLHIGNGAISLAGWEQAEKSNLVGYSNSVDSQN